VGVAFLARVTYGDNTTHYSDRETCRRGQRPGNCEQLNNISPNGELFGGRLVSQRYDHPRSSVTIMREVR
jgi:hypothetical protein